jgi:acid phosphatase family membrane protein YuiD
LELSRHKTIEVIVGFITGVLIGGLYLYVFNLFV